jgi:hypothetical protein
VDQALAGRLPAEHAVAPDQLQAGLVLAKAQGQVPQVPVQALGGGGARPRAPGAPEPVGQLRLHRRGVIQGRDGVHVQRRRLGRVVQPAPQQAPVDTGRERLEGWRGRLLAHQQPGLVVGGGLDRAAGPARVGHDAAADRVTRPDPAAGDGGQVGLPEQLLPAGGDVAHGPVEHGPHGPQVAEQAVQPLDHHRVGGRRALPVDAGAGGHHAWRDPRGPRTVRDPRGPAPEAFPTNLCTSVPTIWRDISDDRLG